MRKTSARTFAALIALLCFLLDNSTYSADDGAPDDDDRRPVIEMSPTTVTARKWLSKLQETPISLTAFSSRQMQSMGVEQIPDLALRAPGLTIGNNGNTSSPEIFLRGVGTNNLSIGSDLSIGVYLDDVYIGRDKGVFFDLFDVERIEVLRGPQGTLYGRNAIGGAINIVTEKPTRTLSTAHQLTIGNYDFFKINQMISGPIVPDKLLGRFAYSYADRDGFTENVFDGSQLADVDQFGARGNLSFKPSMSITYSVGIDYSEAHPAGIAYKPIVPNAPLFAGYQEPNDTYKVKHDTSSKEDRKLGGLSGRVEWELDRLTFVSITGIRGLEHELLDDVDATDRPIFDLHRDIDQEQLNQEFRLFDDTNKPLQWLVGAFFFAERTDDVSSLRSFGTTRSNLSEAQTGSVALFGESTYYFTDRFGATIGIRYSYEQKDFQLERVRVNPTGVRTVELPRQDDDEEWEAWTPKLTLQGNFTDDLLWFATVARGFKSGGYDSFQLEPQFVGAFDPEHLTSYEIGLKTSWLNQRLIVNTTAFYYDHTDIQVATLFGTPGTPGAQLVTTNAAKAIERGAELEVRHRPMDSLDISGNIALLDTEYTEFINRSGVDVSNNSMIRAPELSSGLAIQYTIPITGAANLVARAEQTYQSRIFFTETNEKPLSQRPFESLNARLAYETNDTRLAIALFGKNLTDEEVINVAADLRGSTGEIIRAFAPPRTYGVELTYRY